VNPSERIRRLLHVAQLDTLFPTYDNLEAALAAES
jgi:anti-anti-sigma regulatory factor